MVIIVLIPMEKNNNTAAIINATSRFVFISTPPSHNLRLTFTNSFKSPQIKKMAIMNHLFVITQEMIH